MNKWDLVNEVKMFIFSTETIMRVFRSNSTELENVRKMSDFKNDGKMKEFKALEWEIFKFNKNDSIMIERKDYLKNTLLVE